MTLTPTRAAVPDNAHGARTQESCEIASVAAEPAEGVGLLVATFQIRASEVPAFLQREAFFHVTPVAVHEVPEHPWTDEQRLGHENARRCLMCLRFADETELVATNFRTRAEFDALVKPWYPGDIFRRDILPCRVYLKHCLTAAERLGADVLANFLATTYLADGSTSLGAYLAAHPTLLDGVQLGPFSRYQG